jgi:hypothetical protein
VGTYVLPIVQKNAPNDIRKGQDPFFVSSALCIFSAFLAFFLLPQINQVRIYLGACSRNLIINADASVGYYY